MNKHLWNAIKLTAIVIPTFLIYLALIPALGDTIALVIASVFAVFVAHKTDTKIHY